MHTYIYLLLRILVAFSALVGFCAAWYGRSEVEYYSVMDKIILLFISGVLLSLATFAMIGIAVGTIYFVILG